ncbi:formate dehydrogenase subunit delta [Microvirga alba]|uniref:Formate dehydrogenase subunit delta n=1 Tax=Microvirga alba TaxID=2791025 RepID=A0A931BNH9_9HYPH|nr:formate dehydrogenase subunit delta [Microvirga alba]MBF9234511.1 formate dehydrogenase subunit delta [Microvirga alba]
MGTEKLIRMANQIADFFRSYPEEEAIVGIRDHLVAYWTPDMRNSIVIYADKSGGELDPLVVRALRGFQTKQGAAGGVVP